MNGQSNNLDKAIWLMGQHLEFEYADIKEYTLFHNPSDGGFRDTWESTRDKMGFTTAVTRKFAEVLLGAQANDHETTWLVHSQGGAIFAEGTRYILNNNSSRVLNNFSFNGINNPDKGTILNKQKAIFHGNANNNFRSKFLFKRAGIEVVAIRQNDFDLVPNIVGMNAKNLRQVIGSVVYINHIFSGSVYQSPHTMMQKQADWDKNMSSGPGKGRGPTQKAFHLINNYLK